MTLVSRPKVPALDVGSPGQFDEHGVILGDVVPVGDSLVMAYVGFQRLNSSPFRANTGIAIARPKRDVFDRDLNAAIQISSNPTAKRSPAIQAVHSLRISPTNCEALFSEGDSWEVIRGRRYPRYSSFAASGPNLHQLQADERTLLPHPRDVYRLGRPTRLELGGTSEHLVATGMSRSQIYQPYVFKRDVNALYTLSHDTFPVKPGDYPWCTTQVSYPTAVVIDDRAVIFLNGDKMGAAGAYYMVGHRL